MRLEVDGRAVDVPEGATVLDACDLAGHYVPRLCSYPGIGCCGRASEGCCDKPVECGLCVVRVGDPGRLGETAAPRRLTSDPAATESGGPEVRHPALGVQNGPLGVEPGAVDLERGGPRPVVGPSSEVLACSTYAEPGMAIYTQDPGLQALRLRRLGEILAGHPHLCLSCPDRDGCARVECSYGIPVDARCCDELGRCELGKLLAYVDTGGELPRRAIAVSRSATTEGRIRREPGLCVGCGRCVAVCATTPEAGRALCVREAEEESGSSNGRGRALPTRETLRASGCTFCGQCVMVCPTGAVTAPGEAGERWLAERRHRVGLAEPVLPPDAWRPLNEVELGAIPGQPGVFVLATSTGAVLRIAGVADLSTAVAQALTEPSCSSAARFRFETAPLYTQRESELLALFVQEHGGLPPGNDIADDLFGDDLF